MYQGMRSWDQGYCFVSQVESLLEAWACESSAQRHKVEARRSRRHAAAMKEKDGV